MGTTHWLLYNVGGWVQGIDLPSLNFSNGVNYLDVGSGINEDGTITISENLTDEWIQQARSASPNLKIFLAFTNPWGWISSESLRQAFADSAKEVCEKLSLNGVTLDWEAPQSGKMTQQDMDDFVNTCQCIYETFQGSSLKLDLGINVICDKGTLTLYPWSVLSGIISRVEVMAYDMTLKSLTQPDCKTAVIEDTMDYLIKVIDPGKINLGVPFYTYQFENIPAGTGSYPGLEQPGKLVYGSSWSNVYQNVYVVEDPSYVDYFINDKDGNQFSGDSYAYNAEKGTFINFVDLFSLQKKAAIAMNYKLGGVWAFWLSGDYKGIAIGSVISALKQPDLLNAPTACPTAPDSDWARRIGSLDGKTVKWVEGYKVRYAVCFYNDYGDMLMGPWTEWLENYPYAMPMLHDVPTDQENKATGRRIFRQFLGFNPELIGSIKDNSTTTFQDENIGAS